MGKVVGTDKDTGLPKFFDSAVTGHAGIGAGTSVAYAIKKSIHFIRYLGRQRIPEVICALIAH